MRTMTRDARDAGDVLSLSVLADEPDDGIAGADDGTGIRSRRQDMNDSDCERHFNG